MFFNLIHKPQAEGAKYREAFMFQRKCAHDLGLKVTNFVATPLLTEESVVSLVKSDIKEFGDDVGLLLFPLAGMGGPI